MGIAGIAAQLDEEIAKLKQARGVLAGDTKRGSGMRVMQRLAA